MKEAIKYWPTLSLQRQFKVLKSSPRVYEVRCVRSECPFRVYASKGKWKDFWEVTRVVEHTYLLKQLESQHRNLTAGFVVNYMYPLIVDNSSYEPQSIICAVEEEFKYKISYNKAFRAKQKALKMRWGTYEASYHNMPTLLQTICLINPGSYYDLKMYPCAQNPGKQVLQQSFLALGACIEAFLHCRHVICIDETFLTGMYKGIILTAVAADGNR